MFMFMGTFASCSESAAISRGACDAAGAHWRNPWVGNFDSFGAAMLTLFQARYLTVSHGAPTVPFPH